MTTILKTTSLGEIRGKVADGVVQYLGIKYASLRNRFADAELIEKRDGDVLDATKDGPAASSPLFGCDLEQSAIQHTLPKKEILQSDIDCLNLNITVPEGTTSSSKLPVFLFVHGGGFVIGANSWPQFDYARFVKLSAEKNLPIVGVSINYRLGVFGFLTSEELRNAGYKANNAIRDQRVAMQWVQKHIRDFGGDPDNVTLAGMSAGGASVTLHLHCDQPLFKRTIVMSGTYLLVQPLPYSVHEEGYRQAMKALGLENATPEERIKALLETPPQDLISKIPPSVPVAPAVDGDLIPSALTYAQTADKTEKTLKAKAWCKDLLIGDAQIDASVISVLMPHLKQNAAKRFIAAMRSILSAYPTEAEQIIEKYGLSENTPDEEAFTAVLNFMNDVSFFAPVLKFAQGWDGNAYVYYFNEGNPWDGPWKNRASHILDLAYLFQNYREFLTPAQQAVASAFAEDLFMFCHGLPPWPAVKNGDIENGFTARVYGPSDVKPPAGTVSQPYGGESMRRSILFDYAARVPLDDLAKVAAAFRSGI
ncbi:putative carboxylesterase [Thermoascus aurantiacus ATCC 26904]